MTHVFRHDQGFELLPSKTTAEGFILAEGYAAKPAVLTYRHADGTTTRELIPAEELHRPDSLATLARAVLTLEHPREDVGPANVSEYSVGDLDGEVVVERDGFVKVRLAIRRGDAIDAFRRGVRELSTGRTVRIDATPGVHPTLGPYDAIQRDLRYNHLALTAKGRNGPSIRVRADGAYQITEDKTPMNQNITYVLSALGLSDDLTRADADNVLATVKAGEDAATNLATVTEERDALKVRVDALLDAANGEADRAKAFHVERSRLEGLVKAHKVDADLDALDNEALRRVIVLAVNTNARQDAEDAYYQAALDMLPTQKDGGDKWSGFDAFANKRDDGEKMKTVLDQDPYKDAIKRSLDEYENNKPATN